MFQRPLDRRVFANVVKAFCKNGPMECTDMTRLCSVLIGCLGSDDLSLALTYWLA
jgi:hypothetical protein